MCVRRIVKTLSINRAFCCALLSIVFLFMVQPTIAQSLSDEATQLLAHIKTKVAEYNAQFKSDEIEFSITLSQKIPQGTDVLENLSG